MERFPQFSQPLQGEKLYRCGGGTQDTLGTRGLDSPPSFDDLWPSSIASVPSIMLRHSPLWLPS